MAKVKRHIDQQKSVVFYEDEIELIDFITNQGNFSDFIKKLLTEEMNRQLKQKDSIRDAARTEMVNYAKTQAFQSMLEKAVKKEIDSVLKYLNK